MSTLEAEDILDHEGVRALLKLPTVSSVHWLRRRKKIPHIRQSYRSIIYSRRAVLDAISRLEVKAAGTGRI